MHGFDEEAGRKVEDGRPESYQRWVIVTDSRARSSDPRFVDREYKQRVNDEKDAW